MDRLPAERILFQFEWRGRIFLVSRAHYSAVSEFLTWERGSCEDHLISNLGLWTKDSASLKKTYEIALVKYKMGI